MFGCAESESSMTGSTREGPPQPQEYSAPLTSVGATMTSWSSSSRSSCSDRCTLDNDDESRLRRKMMTPVRPTSGQPMQLTPLWEHVVRTKRFPSNVDTRETFDEISERLRDPEWEVRQHGLRVLVDVLPTIDDDTVDEAMITVLPELINNLGHVAPAVRKGALDTLRVYLVCSHRKEEIIDRILDEGLTRPDDPDNFPTNVTLGLILSTPSLLFPSSSSPRPSEQTLRRAIGALILRLTRPSDQEASVRSLAKIHETIGDDQFDLHLAQLDDNAKRDYEVLRNVYSVKPSSNKPRKRSGRMGKRKKDGVDANCNKNDAKTSEKRNNEINENSKIENDFRMSEKHEDEDITVTRSSISSARIVLETEIKFNEETAITMTIHEEKIAESDDEFVNEDDKILDVDSEIAKTLDDDYTKEAWIERRKTPRRVHFGGEIVKLRTPDSDDSEIVETVVAQTRIPLPITPTTKMPEIRGRRSSSNPSSPSVARSRVRRSSSATNSPKRGSHSHDASMSPKKSILTKRDAPSIVRSYGHFDNVDATTCKKIVDDRVDELFGREEDDDRSWAFEICEDDVAADLQDEMLIRENSSNASNNGGIEGKRRNSVTANSETVEVSEIGVDEAKNDVKMEKVVTIGGSGLVDATENDRNAADEEIVNTKVSREDEIQEIEDKLENSRESQSSDGLRRSPRSAKKLLFESFPRKERNYILMELSSPIKTNARNNDDNREDNEDRRSVRVSTNGAATERDDSTMRSSTERTLGDSNSGGDIVDTSESEKSRVVENNEKIVGDGVLVEMKTDEMVEKNEILVENANTSVVPRFRESSWEELGIVDQEVLNDLHNKDDWRARVRGLERVASALRTSSALIAIESRLGSLLQSVLGGERSCRVAAAGMAVARVVVAGVSEEALKRRLPQVAWGLARQGGPNAAQLARVAMLRLRPALLLEQLLQPHCIKARNAKTRENALQLLIFSLVTFPSTEFKVENVANKVATMVADRRRRVRQAALDTLAVLAQIYEPEEVMQAGKLAAKGQQDGEAMLAAIRARLARKSLPMVSADGLVVYGLQISPTVQIATGPDVDWIVAGSGSVSPGTGRTRGQIIATTTRHGVNDKNAKNESMKNPSSSKIPNFVALGVGLESKNENQKPLAWQLVQHSAKNETRGIGDEKWNVNDRDDGSLGKNREIGRSRLTGSLRYYRSATDRLNDSFESVTTPIFLVDDKDVIMKQRKTEDNFHRRMDEIYAERTGIGPTVRNLVGNRLESRIPVAQSRDRRINVGDSRIGTSHDERRNNDGNNLENWSASSRESEISRYRSIRRSGDRSRQSDVDERRFHGIARETGLERLSSTRDTSRSIYQQRRGYADGNVYREVQTAPTTTSYDVSRRRQSLRESVIASRMPRSSRWTSTESQTFRKDSRSRGLVVGRPDRREIFEPSITAGDKTGVDEEELNEINKRHSSVQTNPYRIQNLSDHSAQFPARSSDGPSETSSNDSSNTSVDNERRRLQRNSSNDRQSPTESLVASEPEIGIASPSRSPILEKSFDVITRETNPSRKNSIDYGISGNEVISGSVVYSSDPENEEYEIDKGSSTDDASVLPGVQSCNEKFAETPIREEPNDDDDNDDDDDDDDDGDDDDDVDDDDDDNNNDDDDSSEVGKPENRQSSLRNVATSFVSNGSNSSDEGVSKVSDDSPASNESRDIFVEASNSFGNPSRLDSAYAVRSVDYVACENSSPSTDETDGPDSTVAFTRDFTSDASTANETMTNVDTFETGKDSGTLTEVFFRQFDEHRIPVKSETVTVTNIVSIPVASRPHSRLASEYVEASFQPLDIRQPGETMDVGTSAETATTIASMGVRPTVFAEKTDESPKKFASFDALPDKPVVPSELFREPTPTTIPTTPTTPTIPTTPTTTREKINQTPSTENEKTTTMTTTVKKIDRPSSNENDDTTTVPEIILPQSGTSENNEAQKKFATSRIRRIRPKTRTNLAKVAPMPTGPNFDKTQLKSKPVMMQCLTQLESNDWEVAMKGLKVVSEIAIQHPEQLDYCGPGTLGRLLGRHVRNLRSQVSRAACLAAGDVFGSQARCIDQDLDDIAGPLLNRTADTNKFLRADSNEALDRMVEHLPANKTVVVIVHRGATHQNAIVRAASARLLASIVDRLGPDWAMSLPRDVREKLIATGAKLLMDGNLDARNHAKRMIRKLARCDGFRKALTDSVPEATLRHIDKTLKSL